MTKTTMAEADRIPEAKEAGRLAMTYLPQLTASSFAERSGHKNPDFIRRLTAGMVKAGIPEK